MSNSKLTIFLDCDDTILCSSEAVIKILNKRYHSKKTVADMKDWAYRSIVKGVSQEEIVEIYESQEFWDTVEWNETFLKVYNELKDDFNWVIVSKGAGFNLIRKEKFLREQFGNSVEFHGILHEGVITSWSKGVIDMSDGILIDDRTDAAMGTNAECRIIIQNGHKAFWNSVVSGEDNMYEANDWNDIYKYLVFWRDHPEFVKLCYSEEE